MVVKVALSLSGSHTSRMKPPTILTPANDNPPGERNGKREQGHHSFLNPPIKQARLNSCFTRHAHRARMTHNRFPVQLTPNIRFRGRYLCEPVQATAPLSFFNRNDPCFAFLAFFVSSISNISCGSFAKSSMSFSQ